METNYRINFTGISGAILNLENVEDGKHYYLKSSGDPKTGLRSLVALEIMNSFIRNDLGVKNHKTEKRRFVVEPIDSDGNPKPKSIEFNYSDIMSSLKKIGYYERTNFNLPELECHWLDKSINMSINFHRMENEHRNVLTMVDSTPQVQYGQNYPIKLQLDREGHMVTSFQSQLLLRVIQQRSNLVRNSHNALSSEWLLDLRTLINDAISMLDITLNQIYIKAEYDPQLGWKFEKSQLGEKHGRRILDKISWVRKIAQTNLDIENEIKSLNNLRQIRNHFNHFDPPSFAVSLEEACTWINQVIDVGIILYKIRKAIRVPCSDILLNFLLQRVVEFNPEPAFKDRLPPKPGYGYESSTWPKSDRKLTD